MTKILSFFFFVFSLLFPSFSYTQGNLENALGNLGTVGQRAGTTETEVENVLGSVIRSALTLVGTIFFVLMIYAGYLWMTARGKEEQIEKAKNIISASIIGLVIIASAYAITVFVTARFQ